MKNDGSSQGPGQPSRPKTARPKPRGRRRRGAGELDAWAEEIYAAPQDKPTADEGEAQVIVSTRLRKPKVHLMAPATAGYVDLRAYMGRWYEIARLPYFTQRRCMKDVHADYVLGDDGMVYVTNRCTHQDGTIGTAKGVARVVDRSTNARLEISFRTLYGVHVLWDDYWIIGVGADYEYALVGQPTRKRGWVLSRDRSPSEQQVEAWLAEFADKGFPADELLRTRQDPGADATTSEPAAAPAD
ncbi:lipocalin family protein [Thiohalocapsa halophila]|jgi:apolipoprotein D and lipocalin family protein